MTLRTFGNAWQGDGLWNLRIGLYGIEASFCFLARDAVPVNRIRYFNAWSNDRQGYHLGNGGQIRIQLRPTLPGLIPSGVPLASCTVFNPLAHPKQLLMEFDRTAVLNAGEYYHLVFSNMDPEPDLNHVSINAMATMLPRETGAERFPRRLGGDMTVLLRDRSNQSWRLWKPGQEVTPIFTLYHSISSQDLDGVSVQGYGGMESWVAFPRPIAGREMVRQVFEPAKTQLVENVAVRLAKSGSPGDLTAILTGPGVRAVAMAKPWQIPPVNITANPPNRIGHGWVVMKFQEQICLEEGNPYKLTLSAPAGDAYEIFPLRDGREFGYSSPWPNSWAEYSSNAGKSWSGWDAWGKKDLRNSHLQLFFNG